MVDSLFKRNLKAIAGLHGVLLLLLVIVPWLSDCRREQPHELVTYIDVQVEDFPPEPVAETVNAVPEPPQPQPEPDPLPEPEPEPEPEPRPASSPRVQPSRERVRRSRQTAPAVDPERVRRALAEGMPDESSSPATSSDLPGWYYAAVRRRLYEAWRQPRHLAAGSENVVRVRLRILRDGTVAERRIIGRSGIEELDSSVEAAVSAVDRMDPLPSSYSGRDRTIVVDFELTR